MLSALVIELPAWLVEQHNSLVGTYFPSDEQRMEVALHLARTNIREQTGGPFGAAIFDSETGECLGLGVNLVTTQKSSVLHAEVVALLTTQKRMNIFSFGELAGRSIDLVASTEPCAMCYGATHWSGVRRLLCGARDEDARAIGFDEGPKLSSWAEELQVRGITVLRDVLRSEAASVLQEYQRNGGVIYNGVQ